MRIIVNKRFSAWAPVISVGPTAVLDSCKLKITSLTDRRLRDDLIETCKTVTGKIKVQKE